MTKTTKTENAYLIVFAEKLGQSKRDDKLIRIGVAFPHKQGGGLNIVIDALPLSFSGKLVILSPKDKVDESDA